MVPINLKIRNFMSYGAEEVEIDFRTFSIACLSGKNGHGKSALLDAILYGLWGKGRPKLNDELINRLANDARVELEFETEGVRYRVIRQIQRKKNGSQSSADLQVYDAGAEIYRPLATGAGVQAAMEGILKMDYEAFICSSFILQGKADAFTKRSPAERKDVLAGILELEEYEYISKKAREEANVLASKIQFLDAELGKLPVFDETEDRVREDVNTHLVTADLVRKQLEDCAADVEARIQEKSALTVKLESFSAKRTEAGNLAIEEEELKRKIETAKASITAAEKYQGREAEILKRFERYNEVAAEREKLDERYKAWVEAEDRLKELIRKDHILSAEYDRKLKDLGQKQEKQEALYDSLLADEGAICPTCQQTLNAEKREMLLEQTAQGLESIKKELGEAVANAPESTGIYDEIQASRRACEEIGWDPAVKERLDAEYRSLVKVVDEKSILERAQVAIEHHTKTLGEYEENLTGVQAKRAAIVAELAELPAVVAQLKEVEARLVTARRTQENLKASLTAAEEGARKAERLLEDIIKTARRTREIEAEKEAYIKAQKVNAELSKAYGKNGIPALIIEHAVPDIEAEANQILSNLTEGKMSLSLEMLKPTQKGTEKETLDIILMTPTGPASYETFSGGQAFRIDFALRVAISKFIANRSGAQLRTLVIDEGFGSQDEEGKDAFVRAINSVKDDFDKVIVITHIKDLRDRFPVRIEVNLENEDKGSTVEVVHA